MATKKTSRKSVAKKSARKPAPKPARKPAAKKTARKASPKKSAAKAVRKPAAKKSAKKAVKKTAARIVKKAAKKTASKKPAAKKTAAKKSAAKKTVARKSTAKKTAKKPAIKKPAAKKTAARTTARKTTSKPAAQTASVAVAAPKAAQRGRVRINPELAGVMTTGEYAGVHVHDKPQPLPRYSPYTRRQLDKMRQILLEDREKARETMRGLDKMTFSEPSSGASRENPGYSTHLGEYASDFQAAETNINLRAICDQRLAQVEQALDRMDDGLYGVCVSCAATIGTERLAAKPFAVLCKPCRENFERRRHGA